MTGSSVSLTVTVNMQVDPTDAVQVTVVVPTGNRDPLAGTQVIVPHIPVVVGSANFTTAPHWPASLLTVMFAGQVSVQGVTVTVNMQLAMLLEASVAVQVTVVVPLGKVEPEAGVHMTEGLGQLSVGVGVV
jgi:hypothetical protein